MLAVVNYPRFLHWKMMFCINNVHVCDIFRSFVFMFRSFVFQLERAYRMKYDATLERERSANERLQKDQEVKDSQQHFIKKYWYDNFNIFVPRAFHINYIWILKVIIKHSFNCKPDCQLQFFTVFSKMMYNIVSVHSLLDLTHPPLAEIFASCSSFVQYSVNKRLSVCNAPLISYDSHEICFVSWGY